MFIIYVWFYHMLEERALSYHRWVCSSATVNTTNHTIWKPRLLHPLLSTTCCYTSETTLLIFLQWCRPDPGDNIPFACYFAAWLFSSLLVACYILDLSLLLSMYVSITVNWVITLLDGQKKSFATSRSGQCNRLLSSAAVNSVPPLTTILLFRNSCKIKRRSSSKRR